jgi:hypothetical protein
MESLWPYDNKGVTDSIFLPETNQWNESKVKAYKEVIGGTIVLRHWWAPLIKVQLMSQKKTQHFMPPQKSGLKKQEKEILDRL